MARERVLIVGGGVSGLAAAGFLSDRFDCLLVEREPEIGGYCRTIHKDNFTWDYSGHFFHFRNNWIAEYVHRRMDVSRLLRVARKSRVYFRGQYIDFPFQFNIHQLPLSDFVHCLADMYAASRQSKIGFSSFRDMVYSRYGRKLADLFLVPYNEKLYSLPAEELDAEAMGRFFPHIEFATLLEHIATAVDGTTKEGDTYNANFNYHKDGAQAYVEALASYIPKNVVQTGAVCQSIDLKRKRATVDNEEVTYDRLIVTAPLPSTLSLVGWRDPQNLLTANKVLVLNLGFDHASNREDHWVYYPEPEWTFFRVGHYDNILGQGRMSLYVEISMAQDDKVDTEASLDRALVDLKRAGVVDGHALISWAAVLLDPAYVHITREGQTFAEQCCTKLAANDVTALGRYGRWVYCSIEDNILQAYNVAREWGAAAHIGPAEA
jgi:protoporphyrinogen oxidase